MEEQLRNMRASAIEHSKLLTLALPGRPSEMENQKRFRRLTLEVWFGRDTLTNGKHCQS
jgi:hypothetical protein